MSASAGPTPEFVNGVAEIVTSAVGAAAAPAIDLFYPMGEFYERMGAPAPRLVKLEGADVPEPYRSLLVHDRDMTPTLTEAYQRTMRLRILNRFLTDTVFSREIVLEAEGSASVTVFAAIKIYLDLFPPEARRLVLEGKLPFGTILKTQGMIHSSRPLAFFQTPADDVMRDAFKLTGQFVLYGRRNALLNAAHLPLAQVLEILPPTTVTVGCPLTGRPWVTPAS